MNHAQDCFDTAKFIHESIITEYFLRSSFSSNTASAISLLENERMKSENSSDKDVENSDFFENSPSTNR